MRGLLDLAPEQATVLGADDDERVVPTADLAVGDLVLVRPGERIGADGEVLDGVSEVDQATITGEPMPVPEGSAATRCSPAPSTAPARSRCGCSAPPPTRSWPASSPWCEEASATKARTQLFIEKVEQRYSVGMVARDPRAVPGPAAARRGPAADAAAGDDVHDRRLAVRRGAGHDAAAAVGDRQRRPARRAGEVRRGDGDSSGQPTLVAFDKTGTLTEGTPRVAEVEALPGSGLDDGRVCWAWLLPRNIPASTRSARAVVAAATRARPRRGARRGLRAPRPAAA